MTRGWLIHLPLVRAPHPGCPGRDPDRSREMLLAAVPARALPKIPDKPATGPFQRWPGTPAVTRQAPGRRITGGWLEKSSLGVNRVTRGPKNPPAEPRWQPPPLTRRPTLGHRLRGIPSHLNRTVRDPSGSGSAASMTWGWRVWKKWWEERLQIKTTLTTLTLN